MRNALFVFIDSLDKTFYLRYKSKLNKIHANLLHKTGGGIVLGGEGSQIAEERFKDLKSMYLYIAEQSKGRDIIICDAFAGMLSVSDTGKVLDYMRAHDYDVCLTENLPEGLAAMSISHAFIDELAEYIDEGRGIVSSFKDIINWEYKGIDVGIYLQPSMIIMERIEFLPSSKSSVDYILKYSLDEDININSDFFRKDLAFYRGAPQYVAVEICAESDGFCTRKLSSGEMDIDTFRKIVTEIDEVCPEALISIGVWGEPFKHSRFKDFMNILKGIPNPVLIESRALFLSGEYIELVQSRKNTEIIFDVSFTTEEMFKKHKNSPYTLEQIKSFLKSLPDKSNVWIRLTRTPANEESIKYFLKEYSDFMPRVLITKADSFTGEKVVDLAPVKRHACYALRREITVMNDGSVLLCRQTEHRLGSIKNESLLHQQSNTQTHL